MEKIFNLAFVSVFAGLFFARLFFVILYFTPLYLNPLAFLLFPYFPGLSLPGGLLGGSMTLMFLLGEKKYPEGRIFDFFSVSFFAALFLSDGILAIVTFLTVHRWPLFYLATMVLTLICWGISLRLSKSNTVKEGSAGLFSIMLFSLFSLVLLLIDRPVGLVNIIKETSLWIIDFLVATGFFFRQDSLPKFVKGVFGK